MVEAGQQIKIHYTGTLDNGNQFDSSQGRDPLEFKVGAGMVIPGFDKGVMGMSVGEKKSIHIPVEEAYGPVRDDMVMNVERSKLPPDLEPEVGMALQMRGAQGQSVPVQVTGVSDDSVTIDANHPLAGQNLNFELELVEIV